MVKLGAKTIQSEDDIQGNSRPLPGRYHAVIKDVLYQCKSAEEKWVEIDESESDAAQRIRFAFEVLNGTVPGQEGREVEDDFYLSEKAIQRLQRLALCVNLIDPGAEESEILFSESVGRQLVIEVDEEPYKDKATGVEKKKTKLTFLGMWSLSNKAVEDVPKNQDAIKLLNEATGATPRSQQKTEPVAATATAGGSGDKWADL